MNPVYRAPCLGCGLYTALGLGPLDPAQIPRSLLVGRCGAQTYVMFSAAVCFPLSLCSFYKDSDSGISTY